MFVCLFVKSLWIVMISLCRYVSCFQTLSFITHVFLYLYKMRSFDDKLIKRVIGHVFLCANINTSSFIKLSLHFIRFVIIKTFLIFFCFNICIRVGSWTIHVSEELDSMFLKVHIPFFFFFNLLSRPYTDLLSCAFVCGYSLLIVICG